MEKQDGNMKVEGGQIVSVKGESKKGIGILCGFLGIIGLIIGLVCYKNKNLEYEWKTFIKAWMWTFFILLGISIIAIVIYYVAFLNTANAVVQTGLSILG